MTRQMIHPNRFAVALIAAILCLATAAQAGPPLICHTIEIGEAKSLPWGGHNWNLSGGETYDTKNLVGDTLEILAPGTPVLVRMETLRRATLYARKDPVAAKNFWLGSRLGQLPLNLPATPTPWHGSMSATSRRPTSNGSERRCHT
jgi:hypothetical protein